MFLTHSLCIITVQVPSNVDKLVKLVLTDPLGLGLGGGGVDLSHLTLLSLLLALQIQLLCLLESHHTVTYNLSFYHNVDGGFYLSVNTDTSEELQLTLL